MTPVLWHSPSLTQPRGRQVAIAWSAFARRVQRARTAASKESLARWAPVEFRDCYRCRANVLRAHAVVLDVDQGADLAAIAGALEGLFVITHSTFSATEDEPRWRVVVPLDRPVDADEYDRGWRWLASGLEAEGAAPDYSARDSSRAWAVPAVPPSGFYVASASEGAFASVSDALAAFPPPEPMPMPERAPTTDSYESRFVRAKAYLENVPGAISGSGGHAATFRAAVALVRGFALELDDALALLVSDYNPRCQPPWSVHELRHKVRQAHQRARSPFGWLADRHRDGGAA
jgi:hypothetical protein